DDVETLTSVVPHLPGVWLLMKGLGDARAIPGGREVPVTFTLFVVTQNLRNEAAARHGGKPGEVGAYQVILDTRALLKDSRLGLDIDPLIPGRVSSLFNGKLRMTRAAVWACEFRTAFTEDDLAAEERATDNAADFLTFRAYWDVPPLGNVHPPFPPDQADATDIVHLQQGTTAP
ncbi:MAG: DUF1834 family protein, partial [Rhodospirillaceae bacterium]|nr:DUF1834 family protein [Rhodospirillaceae bacterium]